jgi:hypothetical protein
VKRVLKEMFGLNEADPSGGITPGTKAPGITQGLRISGSRQALETLEQALNVASGARPTADWSADEAEWAEKACMAIGKAITSGNGSVTLPEPEQTPDVDSFNDDTGAGPDEEEGY